jgi:mannonate dehydratase
VRAAADTYIHAGGASVEETIEQARGFIEAGWRNIRLQVGQPGIGSYGAAGVGGGYPTSPYPDGWRVEEYLRNTPRLFESAREALGSEVELLHDAHSRLTAKQAVTLARSLEPYGLFFLEDVLGPEDWGQLPGVRELSPVPIAVGELATSATTAAQLILGGGVDFIRCHISAIGGFTPARKLATLAEFSGVKTAWHAPGDTSPIGAAANVALDLTSPAFGIQEGHVYNDATYEVFPGTLPIVDGWIRANETPGWGIGIDEKAAARYPAGLSGHDAWAAGVRSPDGALRYP